MPLVGARTRRRVAEALPAVELNLTAYDLARIEKLRSVPVRPHRR